MVATEGEHGATRLQNVLGMGLDAVRYRLRRAAVEGAVAIVDHRQVVERVERPRPMAGPGLLDRGRTDRPRAEARAGAVTGGRVERHTADHHIHTAQVAAVAAAGETDNTGVGAFCGGTIQAIAGHGLVIACGLVHGRAP
ncbi:hypothetical protein D3C75_942520 [compost metagenome]